MIHILLLAGLLTQAKCRTDLKTFTNQDESKVTTQELSDRAAEMNQCSYIDEQQLIAVYKARVAGGSTTITYTEEAVKMLLEIARRETDFLKERHLMQEFMKTK
jgi:hypothetical protein